MADAASTVAPLLELRGITKAFPGTLANDDVSLAVRPGSIHALLGENGAGKSTLVKIVYGVLHPDKGEILWQGRRVSIADPNAARRLGIAMVFQHFSLFEAMTVAENIALGLHAGLSLRQIEQQVEALSAEYGLALDAHRRIAELSVGERQRVEILRCLMQDPSLLIMDEPTSVLTPQEADRLFVILERLADEGRAVLYISHRLEEVRRICEEATVLRGGRVVARCDPRQKTARELGTLMIGTELEIPAHTPNPNVGAPVLMLDRLSLPADGNFAVALDNLSLEVRAREVVGIAGVAGNGQSELMEALIGTRRVEPADSLSIGGTPAGHLGPAARRRLGCVFVPDERLGHAAVPDLSLAGNALLGAHQRPGMARGGLIDMRARDASARRIVEAFHVQTPGIETEARSLSGGNLQRYVMGRELLHGPTVMIAAQPTWGVDVGAATAIHEALLDLASRGAAVLVISQDLDELMTLSDRIAVLAGGRLSAARPKSEVTVEELGLMMGAGHGAAEGAHAHQA
jgi:general nucleoside transport system ATP-binding protein